MTADDVNRRRGVAEHGATRADHQNLLNQQLDNLKFLGSNQDFKRLEQDTRQALLDVLAADDR